MEVPSMLIANRQHRLRIASDSCTRGVLSTLTIVSDADPQQLPLLSLIQRKHAIEKGLTTVELYALLAVAEKEYHAGKIKDKYEVKLSWSLKVHKANILIRLSYFQLTLTGYKALLQAYLRHTYIRY